MLLNKQWKDAAQEIYNSKSKKDGDIVETAVSCDGTWQRRGFSSLHSCITVISMENGKILDVEPLSKVCKACKKHEDDDSTELQLLKAKQQPKCKANCTGLSPAIELEGALIVLLAAIISSILSFMGMVTATVSVLLKIYIRKIMMRLLKKKRMRRTCPKATWHCIADAEEGENRAWWEGKTDGQYDRQTAKLLWYCHKKQ